MNDKVIIYTDGACKNNPGIGGWGVLLQYKQHIKEHYGAESFTTNNRMELMAAIQGLEILKRPCEVELYSDSTYVLKGITEWLPNWKRRNWRTAKKGSVKNIDLWQRLDQAMSRHQVEWKWVKGHSGIAGNEHADQLANQAIVELQNRSEY